MSPIDLDVSSSALPSSSSSSSSPDPEDEDLSMNSTAFATNAQSFGTKTIGWAGGIALLVNNITGSGLVNFPSLYQRAGWLSCTLALALIMILSIICGIMVVEAMAMVKGNSRFQKRIEFSSLAHHYFPRWGYLLTQIFFLLSLLCNNLTSIIQSVQVADWALIAAFNRSCALPEFYPSFSFYCSSAAVDTLGDNTPFGNIYLLSLGFLLTALIVLPLGFFNLDDNVFVQKFAFLSVIFIFCAWIALFFDAGLESARVPAVTADQSLVLGTVLFNFAIITSIPSWINEKKPKVSVFSSLFSASFIAFLLFAALGLLGGLAFDPWFNNPDEENDTILDKFHNGASKLGRFTYYFFPVVINLSSIPIFSLMIRYNLLISQVCNKFWANFLGVILPWLLCLPAYTGSGFSLIVNWAGVCFNSVINFLVPPLLYIQAVRMVEWRQRHGIQEEFHSNVLNTSSLLYSDIKSNDQTNTSKSTLEVPSSVLPPRKVSDSALDSLLYESEDDFDHGWSIVPTRYHPYRIPFAKALFVLMSTVCLTAIGLNIYATITGEA
jgi:hypothetical protein